MTVAISLCAAGCTKDVNNSLIMMAKQNSAKAYQIEFNESMRSLLEPIEKCLGASPSTSLQDATRVENVRALLRSNRQPNETCKPAWKGEIKLIRFMIKHEDNQPLGMLVNNMWHNTTARYDYAHADDVAHGGWYYHVDDTVKRRYGICMQQAELKALADLLSNLPGTMEVLGEAVMKNGVAASMGHAVGLKPYGSIKWVLNNQSGMAALFGKQIPASVNSTEAWTMAIISSMVEPLQMHVNQFPDYPSKIISEEWKMYPSFSFGPNGKQVYSSSYTLDAVAAAWLKPMSLMTVSMDATAKSEVMSLMKEGLSLVYVDIKEDAEVAKLKAHPPTQARSWETKVTWAPS